MRGVVLGSALGVVVVATAAVALSVLSVQAVPVPLGPDAIVVEPPTGGVDVEQLPDGDHQEDGPDDSPTAADGTSDGGTTPAAPQPEAAAGPEIVAPASAEPVEPEAEVGGGTTTPGNSGSGPGGNSSNNGNGPGSSNGNGKPGVPGNGTQP
jgi:hypothetical protein